jgi:hypothetical protein
MATKLSASAVMWAMFDLFGTLMAVTACGGAIAPSASWWFVPSAMVLGGFIAAYRSPGVTVYEPGIAAALIVGGFWATGGLGVGVGFGMAALYYFLAVTGARFGEKWQAIRLPSMNSTAGISPASEAVSQTALRTKSSSAGVDDSHVPGGDESVEVSKNGSML